MLTKKITGLTLLLFSCLFFVIILNPTKVSAAYEAGRLIDDNVLLDAKSMDPDQIQSFLNSRGGQIASRQFNLDCDAAGQQSKQAYVSIGAPCGSSVSSANVIYYVAQVYGVNPKVIIATMQKEQSLITAINPTDRQYSQAMGYACPTSGNCNDSSNFFWQVDNGTWVLRYHFERARGNNNWWRTSTSWTCGTEKHLYKPNLYPRQNVHFYDTNGTHYTTVYIQNPATSSFYCYTPHVYNNPQGLYGRAPHGTTGLYYSGSYNFVTFYEQWFGSTQVSPWSPLASPRILVTNKITAKIDPFTEEELQALPAGQAIRFRSKIGDCLRTEHDTNNNANACVKVSDLSELTSLVENINVNSSTSKRTSQQWTCKIDYTTLKATNQCFDASTTVVFQKKITVFGSDYIITKHDAERGATAAFKADRFSPN